MKLRHILLEVTEPKNIIDLYLIMSMPEPTSKAGKFTVNKIIEDTREEVEFELEKIILDELAHAYNMTDEGYESKSLAVHPRKKLEKLEKLKTPPREWELNIYKNFIKLMDKLGSDKFNIIHTFIDELKKLHRDEILQGEKVGFKDFSNHLRKTIGAKKKVGGDFIEWVFREFGWDGSFGGKAWANVTKEVADLKGKKTKKDFLLKFDRIIDMVHNTGELLNKFKKYDDIRRVLDIKAHAIDPNELYKHASRDVQRLFRDPAWQKQSMDIHSALGARPGRLQVGRLGAVHRKLHREPAAGYRSLAANAIYRILEHDSVGLIDALKLSTLGKFGIRDVIDGLEQALKQELIDLMKTAKHQSWVNLNDRWRQLKGKIKTGLNSVENHADRADHYHKIWQEQLEQLRDAMRDIDSDGPIGQEYKMRIEELEDDIANSKRELPHVPAVADMLKRTLDWMEKRDPEDETI